MSSPSTRTRRAPRLDDALRGCARAGSREDDLRGDADGRGANPSCALKRKAYPLILPVVAAAFLASLLIRLRFDVRGAEFDVYAHPAVALCCLVLAAVVRSKPAYLPVAEASAYAVLAALFLAGLFGILYVGAEGPGAVGAELATFVAWTPPMYVLAFLFFGSGAGLRAATLFYCALVALGLPLLADAVFPLFSGDEGPIGAARVVLVHSYLGGAPTIAIVWISARLLDAHASERARAEARAADLQHAANTDFLTGLLNRRSAYDALRHELEEAARYGGPLAVTLFDLDHFKRVNDAHGHDVGDLLLKEVARLVDRSLRKADFFGRWGGEEFVVVSPGTPLEAGRASAERLVRTLMGHRFPKVQKASASFGVAAYRPGDTTETLLKRADDALYAAKQAGRGRVETEAPERDPTG